VALVSFCYDRDWRTAESEFKRAIALKPNYALAHDWYGWSVLAQSGRFEEAFVELRKAQELDPLSLAINSDYATCLYWAGQYEQAIEILRRVVELENNFYVAHIFLGLACLMTGQTTEAIKELQTAQAQSNNPVTSGFLGYVYAKAGKKREARRVLDGLKKQAQEGYVPPDALAVIHLGLGEREQAFEWLRKACDKRTIVSLAIRVDPIYEPLRSDSQFRDLLRRVGLAP
jgi:tetratricopeptide (TPR) repeat protein